MNTSKRFTDYLPLPNQNTLSLFLTDPVEVLDIIEEMKSKESQDFNGVCSKGIKFVAMELSPPLAATIYYVFNLCFKNGKFPANWKISTVNSEISTIYDWFCANKLNISISIRLKQFCSAVLKMNCKLVQLFVYLKVTREKELKEKIFT